MSNDREDLEARIAAYIDGELPPAEAARLEVFLANTDPQLAEQVIGMIGDRHQLRALPKARAPEDLAARIVEQVERSTLLNNVEHFNAHHRPWWQSRAALAAGLLLILGGFSYFILEALHPANPAWQAAVESSHAAPVIAAAPPMPIPAPKPSEAATPDAAAENPPMMATASAAQTQSAAQVANSVPEQPVMLTLAAQTPEDVGRLHTALESLLAADITTNRARSLAPQARFAKALPQDRIPATQPTGAGSNENFQQSQLNNENALPVPSVQSQNAVGQGQAATEPPLVYHLTLRPAQIAKLTQQFQVQTLTRGDQPYALPVSPAGSNEWRDDKAGGALAEAATAPGASSNEEAPIECVITIVPASATTDPAGH